MASLDIEHLDKTYPTGRRALADVTLSVADGELMVLVDTSGLRQVERVGEPTAFRGVLAPRVHLATHRGADGLTDGTPLRLEVLERQRARLVGDESGDSGWAKVIFPWHKLHARGGQHVLGRGQE